MSSKLSVSVTSIPKERRPSFILSIEKGVGSLILQVRNHTPFVLVVQYADYSLYVAQTWGPSVLDSEQYYRTTWMLRQIIENTDV